MPARRQVTTSFQGLSARTQMGCKSPRLLNYTSIQGLFSEQKPLGEICHRGGSQPAVGSINVKIITWILLCEFSTVLFLGLLNHVLQKTACLF